MMKLVAHSFKTNESTCVFNTKNTNFGHGLPQEIVGSGRILDLSNFVDNEFKEWSNRTSKGCTH